jgi:hypothetical protein
MLFQLSGLQELSRKIEARIARVQDAKRLLEEEVEEVRQDIAGRFKGAESEFASHLKIEYEGDSIILSLPYHIGINKNGKPKVSARKVHNPYWPQFSYQPFQDALLARGYTNIEPHPGSAIEPSGSRAPNVRIKAKFPDSFLRQLI